MNKSKYKTYKEDCLLSNKDEKIAFIDGRIKGYNDACDNLMEHLKQFFGDK